MLIPPFFEKFSTLKRQANYTIKCKKIQYLKEKILQDVDVCDKITLSIKKKEDVF